MGGRIAFSRVIGINYRLCYVLCFVGMYGFVNRQFNEFLELNVLWNDSIGTSVILIFIGIHFFHVVVGIIDYVIGFIMCYQCMLLLGSYYKSVFKRQQIILYSIQLIYW